MYEYFGNYRLYKKCDQRITYSYFLRENFSREALQTANTSKETHPIPVETTVIVHPWFGVWVKLVLSLSYKGLEILKDGTSIVFP
jgi:hypothetical protein